LKRAAVAGLVGVALYRNFAAAPSSSFVAGLRRSPVSAARSVARQAYSFGLVENEEHQGLVIEDAEGGGKLAYTDVTMVLDEAGRDSLKGSRNATYLTGWWNTVVGDAELPASGRSYWEVKFTEKPQKFAYEYIGVAEANADPTLPLTRNQNGKGYFLGANFQESMAYRYLEIPSDAWQKDALELNKDRFNMKMLQGAHQVFVRPKFAEFAPNKLADCGVNEAFEKDMETVWADSAKEMWGTKAKNKGTHVGCEPNKYPPIKAGTTVGVDVDMDADTLSFWFDGVKYGPHLDYTNKPVSVKGKKLVPAMSIFGRRQGPVNYFTKVEVKTGLTPP